MFIGLVIFTFAAESPPSPFSLLPAAVTVSLALSAALPAIPCLASTR